MLRTLRLAGTTAPIGRFRSSRARGGFTLIELMVAVVILSVLATVAVFSYRRYAARARSQEAMAFLLEIKLKQETYFATYGQYATTDPYNNFYPAGDPAGGDPLEWETDCVAGSATLKAWCTLGVRPQLGACDSGTGQCTYHGYQTEGWYPGAPAPPANTINATNRPWWYARARGDVDGDGRVSNWYFSSELNEPTNITKGIY